MDTTNVVFGLAVAATAFTFMSEVGAAEAPGRRWAAVMAVLATVVALSEILGHLMHYRRRTQQRYVIRILMMVPIYAVDSLWGFFDRAHSGFIDIARDTYEAFVIYNFFHLLLDLNGGVAGTVEYWRARKPTMPHMFPLRGEMKLDKSAISLWRFFMIQYVILSPACTIATYVLTGAGEYDEDSWSVANAHLYIAMIRCVSVTFAFSALLYFYLATKYNIHDANPTGKFLSIKAVVFLGCWQGVAISVAEYFGVFPEDAVRSFLFKPEDPAHLAAAVAALENWLVILEMFGAVAAHHFVFSYKGFTSGSDEIATEPGYISPSRTGGRRVNVPRAEPTFLDNVIHACALTDVADQAAAATREAAADRNWRAGARSEAPAARGPVATSSRPPMAPTTAGSRAAGPAAAGARKPWQRN